MWDLFLSIIPRPGRPATCAIGQGARHRSDLPKGPPIARILAYTILPDRAATVRERWLTPWQARAPDPEGTPVAARIGASRPSTFMSRTHRPGVRNRFWEGPPRYAAIPGLAPIPDAVCREIGRA